MSLQFPGKPLQEGLKEFGVQVMHGVTGQGLVGGEGPFHEVLEEGLRLAVGEAEEGAVKEEGQVEGVVVAPGAAPLALGGGWGHLPGQAQAVFQDLLGTRLPANKAALAHQEGDIHQRALALQGKPLSGLYPKLLPRPPLACFKSSWVTS